MIFPFSIGLDGAWIGYYFDYISRTSLKYLRESFFSETSFEANMMWLLVKNIHEGDSEKERDYSRLTQEMRQEWHKEFPNYKTLMSLHRKRNEVFPSQYDQVFFENNILYLQNSKKFLRNKAGISMNDLKFFYLMLERLNKKREIYDLLLHIEATDLPLDHYGMWLDLRSETVETSLEEDREYALLIKVTDERITAKDHWALVNHLFNNNTWEEG